MDRDFAPIYSKDDYTFVIPNKDQIGHTAEEAWKIGLGTQLVEGIMLGFRSTGRTLELTDNVLHVPAKLGSTDIALLSGPLFDECVVPKSAPPAG